MSISILFLSSAEIAQPLFESLCEDENFEVVGLICQPDKAVGRGQKLKSSKAKLYAEEKNVAVFQPEKLSDANTLLEKFQENPPDLLITFAYGQILTKEWLTLPKSEALNVHTSLLPKYRGASPIQETLLRGDSVTGLSLMRMVRKMDAGPVFARRELKISPSHTAGKLHDEFAQMAAEWIPGELLKIVEENHKPEEQDHSAATHCGKISREDAFIDFQLSKEEVYRMWQAYTPWPSIWTKWNGKTLKIHQCSPSSIELERGMSLWQDGKLYIGCDSGSLELITVQLEGKKIMTSKDFLNGNSDFPSSQLPS